VRTLLAIVPDPDNTHLALYFDRTVESLIWAISDSGYVFERYWLPWTVAKPKEFATLADRLCWKRLVEARRAKPGLLIFSKHGVPETLLVFLVGETPTSGVEVRPFNSALQGINSLSGKKIPGSSPPRIDIVGPNFSGSLQQLIPVIEAVAGDFQLKFVSGMVTSEQEIIAFREALCRNGSDRAAFRDCSRHGSLDVVVDTDERATTLFTSYVEALWRRSSRIAVLTESETVYGAQFTDRRRPGGKESGAQPAFLGSDDLRVLLRYPRQISRLRNAYQEESAASAQSGAATERLPGLRATLKEGGAGSELAEKDSVPAFSELQSPASQQAALSAIETTLRREHFDFAGILATDVLDQVFLAERLRMNSPDVRAFVLDADLLFLRQLDSTSLDGMLSVTNYPLFSRNQHWTGDLSKSPERLLSFASSSAEATYNAVSAALGSRLVEYTRPGERTARRPPLWLTVAGRDSYWPIALLDEDQGLGEVALLKGEPGSGQEALHPEYPSLGWVLCFWFVVFYSLLHSLYLWRLRPAGTVADESPKPTAAAIWRAIDYFVDKLHLVYRAYPVRSGGLRGSDSLFLATATIALSCALMLLALPLARFLATDFAWWYFRAAALVETALVVPAIHYSRLSLADKDAKLVLMPAWGLALFVTAAWSWLIFAHRFHTGYFFAYRALSLTSGVSPVPPFLLIAVAFYYWSWVQRKRIGMAEMRATILANTPEGAFGRGHMESVDRPIRELFSREIWAPALLLLPLWVVGFLIWRSFRSVEFWLFDFAYTVSLAWVFWSMAVSWTQFRWCWSRLKNFLVWLERQPIRSAFSRLRKEVAWVPLVTEPSPQLLFISSRTVELLRAMRSSGSEVICSCLPDCSAAEKLLRVLEKDIQANAGVEKRETYKELQECLDRIGERVFVSLAAGEWDQGDSDSLAEIRKRIEEKAPALPGPAEKRLILEEEFIALRCLIFLRYVFRQLRNLLGYIVAAFILSVISMSSYPFHGHRWLGLANAVTFVVLGIGVAIVFAEMDRDAILSRIYATKGDEVGRSFYFRMIRFGTLPLLTLLASQFPAVNHALFSWIGPAFEALK
jgi:hypothetical protein